MSTEKHSFRVGLDARPLSTRVSGVGRLISEILKYFPDKINYEFILFSHLPIHESHQELLNLPNVSVQKGEGFFSKKGGLYFLFELPRQIRKMNLDVFWGSQQVAPLFIPKKLPIVLTYCDLVLYLYPDTMRKIAALQQKFFQGSSVRRADFILSISENTRQDLIKKFNFPEAKTGISYPGADPARIRSFLKTPSSDKLAMLPQKFMLSVSTIEPRKNYPYLLEVFRKYRKLAEKPIPWVIVGKKGWETEKFYADLEDDRKTYNDIIIIDNADDADLHHIYSRAELFLFASVYEGFGIPLLEALIHGRKCIASDIPTFREIGGSSIPYCSLENSDEWVREILNQLKSDRVPEIDLEKFSSENSALATWEVFQKVLGLGK